jgi:hypothetical protein
MNKKELKELIEHRGIVYVINNIKLSSENIRDFKNKMDWTVLSMRQKLSADIIEEFKELLYWDALIYTQDIPEKIIKDNISRITNKSDILSRQTISEDTISEFINSYDISLFNKIYSGTLSANFIINNWNLILKDIEENKMNKKEVLERTIKFQKEESESNMLKLFYKVKGEL